FRPRDAPARRTLAARRSRGGGAVGLRQTRESVPAGRMVLEAGVLAAERQRHFARRAVPLLADQNFRSALVRRIGLVDFVAVNEQDHIGVLFQSARLT